MWRPTFCFALLLHSEALSAQAPRGLSGAFIMVAGPASESTLASSLPKRLPRGPPSHPHKPSCGFGIASTTTATTHQSLSVPSWCASGLCNHSALASTVAGCGLIALTVNVFRQPLILGYLLGGVLVGPRKRYWSFLVSARPPWAQSEAEASSDGILFSQI